jgi:hypothetical protein
VPKDATIDERAQSLGAAMRGDAVLAARVAKRLVGWFGTQAQRRPSVRLGVSPKRRRYARENSPRWEKP